MEKTNEFLRDLTELCAKHRAVLFARTDGKRQILSVELGQDAARSLWLDFRRIDGSGAQPFPGSAEDLAGLKGKP